MKTITKTQLIKRLAPIGKEYEIKEYSSGFVLNFLVIHKIFSNGREIKTYEQIVFVDNVIYHTPNRFKDLFGVTVIGLQKKESN